MSRRVGVTAAAFAMSVGLLLSACDGGEDPTDPPTTESSSSEAPTEPASETTEPAETATPPEVEAPTPAPEAATDDHVGAIHAARYFFDLYTYMGNTGDTTQFEAMSAADCQFCADSIETASAIHEQGGWVEGGTTTFELDAATAVYPTADEPSYIVRFALTEAPAVVYGADGEAAERFEGSTFDVAIALRYVDSQFIVFGVNTG